MKSVTCIENEKHLIVFFHKYDDYDSFEIIVGLLKERVNAIVKGKIDGPDTRVCSLIINEQKILLINDDPYGNYLRAESDDQKIVLKDLLPRLEQVFR